MWSKREHHEPHDAKVIESMIRSYGVDSFEPSVVQQLLEFSYNYVTDLLEDAQTYSQYAGKKSIDMEDVKLAVSMKLDHSFTQPLPREVIFDIARSRNSKPLPPITSLTGVQLPPDRFCLVATNYQLRGGASSTTSHAPSVVNFQPQHPTTNYHPPHSTS